MSNIGEAFTWAFKTPSWFGTFLVMGLIGLIPIIGQINLLGWALAGTDNLRAGYQVLPPAGFQYIARGFNVAVVALVYGLVIFFPLAFLLFGGIIGSAALDANGNTGGFATGIFSTSAFSLFALVGLAFAAFYPVVIVRTEHGGIAGGLNVVEVVRTFLAKPGAALITAVVMYVGSYLGGLGLLACCVGLLVTYPWYYTVIGGAIASYERDLGLAPPAGSYPMGGPGPQPPTYGSPPPVAPA